MNIATTAEKLRAVRNFARNKYAWPGGYPLMLIFEDGQVACAECTRENYRLISQDSRDGYRDGWCAAGISTHMEGPPEHCAACDVSIESAYGEGE